VLRTDPCHDESWIVSVDGVTTIVATADAVAAHDR
jgi:hypothetical protein